MHRLLLLHRVQPPLVPLTGRKPSQLPHHQELFLTAVPTDIVPSYNQVKVDVGVKDYLGNSEVIYQGGSGTNPCEKNNRKNDAVRRADPDRISGKQERIYG